MYPDTHSMIRLALGLALIVSSEGFFFKWGSDNTRQAIAQKAWMQVPPNMSPSYRYYSYNPYEQRKTYQQQYQAEIPQYQQQSMTSIPISVPAGASLTPVSLQHVQLVPCMCPVAPEEADKLQEQVGPGPYLAQSYTPTATYSIPQQSSDTKTTVKQQ